MANSNVRHALVAGEYNERRSDCEAAAHALGVSFLRDATTEMLSSPANATWLIASTAARCISPAKMNACWKARRSLRKGNIARFGELMFASQRKLEGEL